MADDKNTAVNIGIGIKADTSGAKQAADALDHLAASAKNAGAGIEDDLEAYRDGFFSANKNAKAGTKEAADMAAALGEKGAAAKDVYEGLTQAQNLNAASAFGVAKAWQNVSAAIAANPIGAIAAAILAVSPAVFAFIERLAQVDKSLYGTGEKTKKLQEALKGVEEEAKKAGETLEKEVDKSAKAWDRFEAKLAAVQRRLEAIANAQLEEQLARVDQAEQAALANTTSDSERERLKKAFDLERKEIRQNSEREELDRKLKAAQQRRAVAEEDITKNIKAVEDADNLANTASAHHKIKQKNAMDFVRRGGDLNSSMGTAYSLEEAYARKTAEYFLKLADSAEEKYAPLLAKARSALEDAETEIKVIETRQQALSYKRNATQSAYVNDERFASDKEREKKAADALKELAAILSNTLKGDAAGAKQERFSPDNFDSPEARERKRAEADARNQSRTAALNIARAKASSIVSQLGDGKNDQTEAAELIKVLERISVLLNNPTRSRQYQELLGRLQQVESRLSNNRSM